MTTTSRPVSVARWKLHGCCMLMLCARCVGGHVQMGMEPMTKENQATLIHLSSGKSDGWLGRLILGMLHCNMGPSAREGVAVLGWASLVRSIAATARLPVMQWGRCRLTTSPLLQGYRYHWQTRRRCCCGAEWDAALLRSRGMNRSGTT